MTTRQFLAEASAEWLALQQTMAQQPDTTNPVTGESTSSSALAGTALIVGMRGARAYMTDPLPFWLLGAAGLTLGVLVFVLAVRGLSR